MNCSLRIGLILLVLAVGGIYDAHCQLAKRVRITYPAPVNEVKRDGYTLVFQDEFNDTILDEINWNKADFSINTPDWEPTSLNYYSRSDSNVYVKDGLLHITALEASSHGLSYTSGWVNSPPLQFGYYEASIKMPSGACLWPALWMVIPLGTDTSTYQEIDVFELDCKNTYKLQNNIWFGDPRYQRNRWIRPRKKGPLPFIGIKLDLAEDHFIYGVDWSPDKVSFYINNTLVRTLRTDIPYKPLSVNLSFGVGGNFVGSEDCYDKINSVDFPQTMSVDYMRVYKKTGEAIQVQAPRILCGSAEIKATYYVHTSYEWMLPEGLFFMTDPTYSTIRIGASQEGDHRIYLRTTLQDGTIEYDSLDIFASLHQPAIPAKIFFEQTANTCSYTCHIEPSEGATAYALSYDGFLTEQISDVPEFSGFLPGRHIFQIRAWNCNGASIPLSVDILLSQLQACALRDAATPILNEITCFASHTNIEIFGLQENMIQSPYQIYDITGRMVSSGVLTESQANFPWLPSGIYFIQITTKSHHYALRFAVAE